MKKHDKIQDMASKPVKPKPTKKAAQIRKVKPPAHVIPTVTRHVCPPHCACCQQTAQRGADLIRRDGWTCEKHPGLEWPHDDCAGPGMPWVVEGKAEILALKAESYALGFNDGEEVQVAFTIRDCTRIIAARRQRLVEKIMFTMCSPRLNARIKECDEITKLLEGEN